MAKLLDDKEIEAEVSKRMASRLEAIDEAATTDRLAAVRAERERVVKILTDEWARAGKGSSTAEGALLLGVMHRCMQRITGEEDANVDTSAKAPVDDTPARQARVRELMKGPNAGLLVVPDVANAGEPKRLA
jgi:hypothetical protein